MVRANMAYRRLGLESFRCACIILGGIEIMLMISKGQVKSPGKLKPSAAQQFHSFAM
jgi:putative transposase